MALKDKIKPKFWDHEDVAAGPYKHLFNFRRIWKQAVLLTTCVVLAPLLSMALIDYRVTQNALESEILLRTSRLVSNTRRTVAYFLEERKAALNFIDHDNSYEGLNDPRRLSEILENLKKGFGGFVDLGIIDANGRQTCYVGPYRLEGKEYSGQEWFGKVLSRGSYVSDVFLGFRHIPHLVIAVKHDIGNGSFYVIRATIDTGRFNKILSDLEISGMGGACLINEQGTVQTPCRYHGDVLQKSPFPVPEYSERTRVYQTQSPGGEEFVYGYAYIEDSPFILTIAKKRRELMEPWYGTRVKLIGFLVVSVTVILMVILGGTTYLVNRIYMADQKRVMTLHQVEYTNKMASIGRMAAAIAHEINNPLAIINEKAGLIKDLFVLKHQYRDDPKLMGMVDTVIATVERCATITRRLLSFARHMEVSAEESVDLREIFDDVLGFFTKEAEYRSITVDVDVPEDTTLLITERGKLQQILTNLVNNAFAAMDDGGRLNLRVRQGGSGFINILVTDDGHGIPEKDLRRIFEPFFSTKAEKGGTGLGLSVTYGLVQELHGNIHVVSEVGSGTTFTVTLPVRGSQKGNNVDESATGG